MLSIASLLNNLNIRKNEIEDSRTEHLRTGEAKQKKQTATLDYQNNFNSCNSIRNNFYIM